MVATETAKPFDATPIATALEFRKRNRRATGDMVDAAYGATSLQVTASGGTSVNIADGRAIVQGALYELTGGPYNLAVGANGTGSNRTDWAVLTYDDSHTPGVYARVLEGTALTQNDTGVWDMPLAAWQKTPAGAIVNLVDLRRFQGSPILVCSSTGRPSSPHVGQVVYEGDTDQVIAWNGVTWRVIFGDSGEFYLPPANPGSWEERSPYNFASRRSGVVHVELNLRRIGSALSTDSSDASTGSLLVTLPSELCPFREIQKPVVLTAGISARVRYETGGGVYLNAPSDTVGVGRFLRCEHSFLGA